MSYLLKERIHSEILQFEIQVCIFLHTEELNCEMLDSPVFILVHLLASFILKFSKLVSSLHHLIAFLNIDAL